MSCFQIEESAKCLQFCLGPPASSKIVTAREIPKAVSISYEASDEVSLVSGEMLAALSHVSDNGGTSIFLPQYGQ